MKIICLTGESGTGKSTLARYLNELGWYRVKSHTDRPVRDENDDEHIFHSPEKMDELLKKYEPLAYTEWFDEALNRPIRYCVFSDDICKDTINVYVIDDNGLKMLEKHDFSLLKVRIKRDKKLRNVPESRISRDKGKFYLPDSYFDLILENNTDLHSFLVQSFNIIFIALHFKPCY
jgi:guanylate kinase